ncbi:MAG: hypothetical protein P3X24_005985 [bacterium]|nr:hypothetical protein [bacterium]
MRSNRRRRAVYAGAWAFALTLLVLSVWGFAHTWSRVRVIQRSLSMGLDHLAQAESATLQMERALLGLTHADSVKARIAGYDPLALRAELRDAYQSAERAVQSLLATPPTDVSPALQIARMRLELEWLQMQAQISRFIARPTPQQVNPSDLRVFRWRGHDTLHSALCDFRVETLRQTEQALTHAIQALAGYGLASMLSVCGMLLLTWLRWGLPARWFRLAVARPPHAEDLERRLRDTEWAEVYQTLQSQAHRLRAAEQFMRDLAMGRTPEPLAAEDPTDPLARSSVWLLQRIGQLRNERRQTV